MAKTRRILTCALCNRTLPRVNGQLDPSVPYSTFTRNHYCSPRDMKRCRELHAKGAA
jgi:hypothetical protein